LSGRPQRDKHLRPQGGRGPWLRPPPPARCGQRCDVDADGRSKRRDWQYKQDRCPRDTGHRHQLRLSPAKGVVRGVDCDLVLGDESGEFGLSGLSPDRGRVDGGDRVGLEPLRVRTFS